MRRNQVELGPGGLIAYGHYGRPVLAFPTERGRAFEFEENGLLEGVSELLDDGRLKLYCVDSADSSAWFDHRLSTEERARRHGGYERWIIDEVVPWIDADCRGRPEIATLGCSLGAYHAVNIALRHAHRFPLAMGFSGNYDPTTWHGWGELGVPTYFPNPMAHVANLHGDHLDWLRRHVGVLLVVGQGAGEVHPTGALGSTRALATRLAEKGIAHELDVWGEDVPHHWASWQRQLRHHLPRFC